MESESEGTGEVENVKDENIVVQNPLVITQEYIENRPLSYSSLKRFRKSPKHFIQYLTSPKKVTDATLLGKVIDCLVLTPEKFDKEFMVGNKPNLQSNKGKEEWANMLALASKNKQLICTPEQVKIANFCKESLLSTPESARFLETKTRTQVHLEWRDKANNLPIHGWVDFESKAFDEDFVVDLKSTKDADPDEFNKDIFNTDYQYYFQGGCYLVGYHRAKFRFPYFVDLAVETVEPYNVSVNYFDAKVAEIAKNEFYGTLKAFRYCLNNNLFHQGYEFRLPEGMGYFSVKVPGWWKPRYQGFEE